MGSSGGATGGPRHVRPGHGHSASRPKQTMSFSDAPGSPRHHHDTPHTTRGTGLTFKHATCCFPSLLVTSHCHSNSHDPILTPSPKFQYTQKRVQPVGRSSISGFPTAPILRGPAQPAVLRNECDPDSSLPSTVSCQTSPSLSTPGICTP